jgi:hypothetical protein
VNANGNANALLGFGWRKCVFGTVFLGCQVSQLPKLEGHATISILQVQKGRLLSLISSEASPSANLAGCPDSAVPASPYLT